MFWAIELTCRRFFIASPDPSRAQREQRAMLGAIAGDDGAESKILSFFYQKTRELMVTEAWTGVGTSTKSVGSGQQR